MKSGKLLSLIMFVLFMSCLSPATGDAGTDNESKKGGAAVHTYVIFFGFTAQGIQNIKESPSRVEAAKQTVKSMGGEVKAFYAILGSQYDTIFIVEAPDDEAVARMALAIASGGNVRTESHRVFTEEEYRKIVSDLP